MDGRTSSWGLRSATIGWAGGGGGERRPQARRRGEGRSFAVGGWLDLDPPGVCIGAKVRFRPLGELDDAFFVFVDVREGQGQRSRAADDPPRLGVLGAVARADVLVGGLVPGDDAAEVCADAVYGVVADLGSVVDDEVEGVGLEALDEVAVADGVRLEPGPGLDGFAELGAGGRHSNFAALRRRYEHHEVGHGDGEGRRQDAAEEEDVVHQLALRHVRDERGRRRRRRLCRHQLRRTRPRPKRRRPSRRRQGLRDAGEHEEHCEDHRLLLLCLRRRLGRGRVRRS
mmetsp:Transcript_14951/g.48812  ORF Transcript_14951/g.48812 Transcript_14951/m.48812 type:complete len:285 (-) Transcript_14951:8-862(-)